MECCQCVHAHGCVRGEREKIEEAMTAEGGEGEEEGWRRRGRYYMERVVVERGKRRGKSRVRVCVREGGRERNYSLFSLFFSFFSQRERKHGGQSWASMSPILLKSLKKMKKLFHC